MRCSDTSAASRVFDQTKWTKKKRIIKFTFSCTCSDQRLRWIGKVCPCRMNVWISSYVWMDEWKKKRQRSLLSARMRGVQCRCRCAWSACMKIKAYRLPSSMWTFPPPRASAMHCYCCRCSVVSTVAMNCHVNQRLLVQRSMLLWPHVHRKNSNPIYCPINELLVHDDTFHCQCVPERWRKKGAEMYLLFSFCRETYCANW